MKQKIKQLWQEKYLSTPKTLEKMKDISSLAAAFNVDIDSVLKISAVDFQTLLEQTPISLEELQNIRHKTLVSKEDIFKGFFRCFCLGIAEEWIAQDRQIYDWMKQNLGMQKTQMGGQGGIIANTLSVSGIRKIITHVSSLPQAQADLFFKQDNLLSFDENGALKPIYLINRKQDIASVHWILEFDKGEKITIENKTFTCPKSNRFIATYDPTLLNLIIDKNFTNYMDKNPVDYVILSGYQALSHSNHGIEHIRKTLPLIKKWKQNNPDNIIHLEIASTQDPLVRKAIITELAPLVDSIGLNERETMDVLEILDLQDLLQNCRQNPSAENMFYALKAIKQKTSCPRIQLHMFGLYLTLQDKNFKITPQANLNGMLLASVAAASKASLGYLENYQDITFALDGTIGNESIEALNQIAEIIRNPEFLSTGLASIENDDLIAVPTIIINQPKTLVGMGDTISSFSIIGAQE